MKKAGIFAALLAVVVLFMHLYNYKLVGYMETDSYGTMSQKVVGRLTSGVEDGTDPEIALDLYEKSTPIYSRGKKLFAGEDKKELDVQIPMYVNDGQAVMNLADSGLLIDTDFQTLPVYDGLYVTDGMTFNRDRQQADPEEFILISLEGGIYMGAQNIFIESGLGQTQIAENSILYFMDDSVRYYSYEDGGKLSYHELTGLQGAKITIGSVSETWSDFLKKLRGVEEKKDQSGDTKEISTETTAFETSLEETTVPETASEETSIEEYESETETDTSETEPGAGESSGENLVDTENGVDSDSWGRQDIQNGTRGTEDRTIQEFLEEEHKKPTKRPFHTLPSEEGNGGDAGNASDGTSGSGGASAGGNAENNGTGDSNETGGSSDETSGETSSAVATPSNGSTSDGGKYVPKSPKVTVTDFSTGVYNLTANVTIEDPDGLIIKGVRLVLYKDGKVYMRKLAKESGTVTVSPLEPDTEYRVEYYYETPFIINGNQMTTWTTTFKVKEPQRTKPLSYLKGMVVSQQWSGKRYLDKIELTGLSLQDDPDASAEKESAIPYIDTVICKLDPKGIGTGDAISVPVDSAILRKLRKNETAGWISGGILESNKTYEYYLEFRDRFGNALVTVPEKVGGTAQTSKTPPKADIRVDRESTVENTMINVKLDNPDGAEFPDQTSIGADNPYLVVSLVSDPDIPIPVKVAGSSDTVTRVPVKTQGQTKIQITNLNAGRQYQIQIRGSYDVNDGQVYENQVLGTVNYTTGRLSSLGNVNFNLVASDITYSSVDIRTSLRSSINTLLYPYVSKLVFTVSDADAKNGNAYKLVLEKEKLQNLMLTGSATEIPADVVTQMVGEAAGDKPFQATLQVLYPTSDANISVWDALLTQGVLDVRFPDGNIASATQYHAAMRAYASQGMEGSIEEDVTGRYYDRLFRTLKQPANVEVERWFVTDTYVQMRGLKVNDPDGAIKDGKISVRLLQNSNSKVIDIQNVTTSSINEAGTLTFNNLTNGMEYRIEFYALEYNETYNSLNAVTFYQLPILNGTEKFSSIVFKTGASLYGSIEMLSIDSSYDGGMFHASGENLFVINDATFSNADSSTGEVTERSDSNLLLSGLIPVEAGKMYQLTGNGYGGLFFYKADGSFLKYSNTGGSAYWSLLQAPEGAAYIRFYVYPAHLTETCFMKIDMDLDTIASSSENLVVRSEIQESTYITPSTGDMSSNNSYSVSGLIPVEEGMRYVKANAGDQNVVVYYDSNKNYAGYASWADGTDWRLYTSRDIPFNKDICYVRILMKKGWEDKLYFAKVADGSYGENLFAKDLVQETGYYYSESNTKVKNKNYWYSKLIPVDPDSTYYKSSSYGWMMLFDANQRYLGTLNKDGMMRTSSETHYVRIQGTMDRLNQHDTTHPIMLRRIGPAKTQGQQMGRVQITVEDNENYLAETANPEVQVLVQSTSLDGEEKWETENTIHIPMTVVDGKVQKLETEQLMALSGGRKYRLTLQAELPQFDHTLELDQEEAKTDKQRYLIRSEAGFASIGSDPFGEFTATKDIKVETYISARFYGKVDFQGHKITREITKRCTTPRIFDQLEKGAVLENLVYDLTWHSYTAHSYTSAMILHNAGTVQNLIAHFKFNNPASHIGLGGLIYDNQRTGTLENFVIVLDEDYVINARSAPGMYANYGVVRNGYICTENDSKIIDYTPEGDPVDKWGRAGIVSENTPGGTIEQVYSLVDVEIQGTAKNDHNNGTIVGINNGTVKNSFTTGHALLQGRPFETYGPAVGGSSGKMVNENVRYVQLTKYAGTYYKNNFQFEAELQALADQSWYDYSINLDGHFQTDMVPAGYYPRLDMPECIVSAQPMIKLPTLVQPQAPTLVSANVVEQLEDGTYLAEFSFINPQNMRIDSLQLSNRSGNYPNYMFTKAMTCTVKSQSMDQDGVYRVRAVLSDPLIFRSKYYVDYFEARAQGSGTGTRPLVVTDQNTVIYASFFRDIASLDDWERYLMTDLAGNYRLVADLDFRQIPLTLLNRYIVTREFTGSLDGGYTTESGECKNHQIIGLNARSFGSMFYTVTGANFSNLDIVGFMAEERVNTGQLGWIRYVNRSNIQNVHILDSSMIAGNNGGLLTGYAYSSTIQDCSVTNSKITAWENGSITIGGMIGYTNSSTIKNCFVEGIQVEAIDAKSSADSGIGGFVGRSYYTYYDSCYAEGQINTNYPEVGGFAGYLESNGQGSLNNVWVKVDIVTATGNAGGIVGRGNNAIVAGGISVGNIYSRSGNTSNINRIQGYSISGTGNFSQTAAFAGQFLSNGIYPDLRTDEGMLVTAEDLKNRNTYESLLGMKVSSFDLDAEAAGDSCGISQGYLPRLLASDGTLLPHQELISLTDSDMTLNAETLEVNSSAENQFHQKFGDLQFPTSWNPVYQMQFTIGRADGYVITDVSLNGMNLNAYYQVGDEKKETYNQSVQGGQITRQYPFLQMEIPYDQYVLSVVMTPSECIDSGTGQVMDHTKDILLATTVVPKNQLSMVIRNATEWNQVMSQYKDSYGNFEIQGDIDASTLPAGESLITGVRVNRLISYSDRYTIKNVTIDSKNLYEAVIKEVATEVTNLKFEDISIRYTGTAANFNVGVIGQNNGRIHDVEFNRIKIEAGRTHYAGCIGASKGDLENIKLTDIQASSTNNYQNLGGLVGYASAYVRNISASGTVAADGTYSYRIHGTGNYVGGIAGVIAVTNTSGGYQLHVDKVKVISENSETSNVSAIGIAVGAGNISSDIDRVNAPAKEDRSTVSNSVLVKIGGGSQLGGLVGSGTVRYADVSDCRIQGNQDLNNYVGGVSGYGSAYDCTSTKNVVIGNKWTGGAVGYSGWNDLSYTTVSRCVVQGGDYTGGMTGSGRILKNQLVSQTVVEGKQNVGGMVGAIIGDVSRDSNSRVEDCQVTGVSVVGGMAGTSDGSNMTSFYSLGVTGTKIRASFHTETQNSYAGGLIGYLDMGQMINSCYVDENTTVEADGNFVGGLVGYAAGGWYNHVYSAAKINTEKADTDPMGYYVGGLFGGLASNSKRVAVNYRDTKVSESYFAGTVYGQNYVGGIIGLFETGEADGADTRLKADKYSGILLAGDVQTRAETDTAIFRPDANIAAGTDPGQIDGFRIYDQSQANGQVWKDYPLFGGYAHVNDMGATTGKGSGSSAVYSTSEDEDPSTSGSSASTQTIDGSKTMYVDAERLSSGEYYVLSRNLGGLEWGYTSSGTWGGSRWILDGLMNLSGYQVAVNLDSDNQLTLESAYVDDGEKQVKVTADNIGYVTDGLKMHYDGIQNTRDGHKEETQTWENLAGDSHYDLIGTGLNYKRTETTKNGVTIYSGDGWVDNAYSNINSNTTGFGWKAEKSRGERWETMTMSATFTRTAGGWAGLVGFSNWNSRPRAAIRLSSNYQAYITGASENYVPVDDMLDQKLHNLTAVYDYANKTQSLYMDGELVQAINGSLDWAPEEGFYKAFRLMSVGMGDNSQDDSTGYTFKGNLYNAKVYDRILTDEEIAQNYQADLNRFGSDGMKDVATGGLAETVLYEGAVTFANGTAVVPLNASTMTGMKKCDIKVTVSDTAQDEDSQNVLTGALHSAPVSSVILPYTITQTDENGTPTVAVDSTAAFADGTYQWYRSSTPNYAAGIPMKGENADQRTAALAGRGYYYCKVTAGSETAYTPLILVDTDGFLPYLAIRSTKNTIPGQEGFVKTPVTEPVLLKQDEEVVEDAVHTPTAAPEFMQYDLTLNPVSTEGQPDTWYSGGSRLKGGSFSLMLLSLYDQTLGSADPEDIPELTIYPSGVDRINLEFDEKCSDEYYMIVKDSKGNMLMRNLEQRVFTMQYDFRSELTVIIGNHVVSKTYEIDPSELRRTVMVIGDQYYYLSEGNIYSTELLAEGDYIHLYDGSALDSSGQIRVLEESRHAVDTQADGMADSQTDTTVSGQVSGDQTVSGLQFVETTPLYEFEYDGSWITVYERFSVISNEPGVAVPAAKASGAQEPAAWGMKPVAVDGIAGDTIGEAVDDAVDGTIRPFKIVVKDGELYALDTTDSISGSFLTDTYQDQTWMVILGEDGKVTSLADTVKWPSSVAKTGIAHMTNNVDVSQPWILIRYQSGYVKGFNYMTGEELSLINPKSDLSLIDYIGNFFSDKMASLKNDDNQAYIDLISLKKNLTVHPIDESMIISGSKVDENGKGTEETAFAKDSRDEVVAGSEAVSGTGSTDTSETAAPETGDAAGNDGSASRDGFASSEGSSVTIKNPGQADSEAVAVAANTTNDGRNSSVEDGKSTDQAVVDQKAENSEKTTDGEKAANDAAKSTDQADNTSETAVKEEVDNTSETAAKTEAEKSAEVAVTDQMTSTDQTATTDKTAESDSQTSSDKASDNENTADQSVTDTANSDSKTTSDAGDSAQSDSKAESAKPAQKTKYTYVYNVDKKAYELYQTSDLINPKKSQVISEQEKIQKLAAKGVMVQADTNQTETPTANKQDRTGLTFLWIIGISALGLAGLVVYRKRRY